MGKVVHFEVPADDLERAQQFYKTVFGWEIRPMPEMQYTIVITGPSDPMPSQPGFINGGMMKRSADMSTPIITIDVPSIDECAKVIETNGGSMYRPKMAVGDMGFAAYFKDSEGNVVGLWETAKKS